MVNEDILTALRNSIEHGESLQSAIEILINSGYNPKEVQEASKYLGGITIGTEPQPNEQFLMPAKRPLTPYRNPYLSETLPKPASNEQDIMKIKREVSSVYPNYPKPANSLSSQLNEIKPKQSYKKEIVLLIILLVLIAVLVGTLLFKEQIVGIFSQMLG